MEIPNSLQNFHNREMTFPVVATRATKKVPTKINVITLSIPLSDARVINLVLLTLGISLNFLIILAIVCKPSMRTSSNLYVVSLACSNMVILIEPLEEILKWSIDVNMKLNMDYVCMISFDVSIITLSILKLILYIGIFREQVSFGHEMLKKTTTLKGILLTWSSCIISIAIGLHIYDFFEGDMADIYVWFTIMFIGMPMITSIATDALIIYELYILKEIEGSWRMRELKQFVLLVVISIAFLTIRMPYRLARAISFLLPKASCCTDDKRERLYFMAKAYPTAFSLIYIVLSNDFHEIFQVRLWNI
ncbi:hypothetical protein E2986_10239 [Frieseomelitta varia]|uniref:G-protein coupled receptors family 1 profile domain-containing protein n=1 Tax=Frieseomelitta varia TaxID=561572 RepID=A0A833RJW9_9HYME|nr:hypothetical protein E2986_10239 [Frieseomelitta varia]